MAFKFKCDNCGEELTVYYLKKGEEAQCTACAKRTAVPKTAQYFEAPKRFPIPLLGLPVKQDEKRRQEYTQERIASYPSVRYSRQLLNLIWYGGIVIISMNILFRIVLGPNAAFFSTGPYVELDAVIHWDRPLGLDENEQVEDLDRPVLAGLESALVRVPGGISSNPILTESIIAYTLFLTVVFFLRRVFREITSGQPFTKRNAANIRWIGVSVTLAGPIWGIFKSIQATSYIGKLDIPGASYGVSLDPHLGMVVIGLVIVAIAQLFELGARIQTENELTI